MADRDLWSKLRGIFKEHQARKLLEPPEVRPEEYEPLFRQVARRLRHEAACLELAQAAVEDRYQDFETLPAGRRQTVLQSSRPQLLATLARDLMRRSYAARLDDVPGSLRLAERAVEVAEYMGRTDYLSPPALADLHAEALAYLGNARRITADLPGALEALEQAERRRKAGTGDRTLRADVLNLRASLADSRGEAEESARLRDQEIALLRLLGDPARLGRALVARGLTACWDEGLTPQTCALMKEGTELAEENQTILVALLGMAEASARAGKGAEAIVSLTTAHMLVVFVGSEAYATSFDWIQALAFRALGDHDWSEFRLLGVRAALKEQGREHWAAVAATDLLAIYAAEGRYQEAQELAAEAWLTFQNEGLDGAGLAAFLSLSKALQEETATGAAAVAVANYVARYQHNRHARLEAPEE